LSFTWLTISLSGNAANVASQAGENKMQTLLTYGGGRAGTENLDRRAELFGQGKGLPVRTSYGYGGDGQWKGTACACAFRSTFGKHSSEYHWRRLGHSIAGTFYLHRGITAMNGGTFPVSRELFRFGYGGTKEDRLVEAGRW
jgi:hypothetical protein